MDRNDKGVRDKMKSKIECKTFCSESMLALEQKIDDYFADDDVEILAMNTITEIICDEPERIVVIIYKKKVD